jgi:hypothetical protein
MLLVIFIPTGGGIYQGANTVQIRSGTSGFTVNNNANTAVNFRVEDSGLATFSSSVNASYYRAEATSVGGYFQSWDGTNEVDYGSVKSILGSGNSYDGMIYTSHASSSFRIYTGGNYTTPKLTISSNGLVTLDSSIVLDDNEGLFWGATSGSNEYIVNNGSDLILGTGGSPRLTISSVGVATFDVDSDSKFIIGNGGTNAITLYSGSSQEIYMGSNGSYRLRFKTDGNIVMDNGGDLGIGTATPQRKIDIANGGSVGIRIVGNSSGYTQGAILLSSGTDNTPQARGQGVFMFNEGSDTTWYAGGIYNSADSYHICRVSSGTFEESAAQSATAKLTLTSSGALSTTTGSLGTISDLRLKKNITDATSKLSDILSLRVVNYEMKSEHIDGKMLGFIGQELETVFPSLVDKEDTREYNDNGEVTSGYEDQRRIKVGLDFAIFTKAIQEQQTIIEDLKSRIETLEG